MNADNSQRSFAEEQSSEDEFQVPRDREDLHELLSELRAEVTRLKAQQAKQRAQSWIQRYPILALALSAGLGTAAGYGAALAQRPAPPTLSEQARRRLRRLVDDASRVASDVGRELSDRAARSGAEVRERAQETGRRLATRASEQARQAGSEASARLRRAADEATRRVQEGQKAATRGAQEIGESIAKEAEQVAQEQAESVREAVSETTKDRSVTGTLLTVAGLAAGSILAAKMRRWL